VIVHQVIGWTCRGWYEPGWSEDDLTEIDSPSPDETGDVDTGLSVEQFIGTLPPADTEVARLWLLAGLEPGQIAERLDKQPNAIYQARSRIQGRLREWLET
jgi:DNA-directed RNA polymerase specialized sigma24 family protein